MAISGAACQCLPGWVGKNCDIRGDWNPPEICRDSRFDLTVDNQSQYDLQHASGNPVTVGTGVEIVTGMSLAKVASKAV